MECKKKANEKTIFDALEHMEHDETFTFNSFMKIRNIKEHDYIHAIQCTLKWRTIFLKRELMDIGTNSFARHISLIWGENTYAQFVLHAYAVNTYCSSYMKNLDKIVASMFKCVWSECAKNHCEIIETIARVGKLLNIQKMFAQEVTYIVFSLNTSSRKCIFINTLAIDDRTFFLKKPRNLGCDPDDSKNISSLSIIDLYFQWLGNIEHVSLS